MAPKPTPSAATRQGSVVLTTIKVEKPDPSSDPIVVSFPGGLPQGLSENSSSEAAHVPQFVWRRLRENNSRGRLLVGKDATCVYEAQNQGRGNDGRRTKLCVGIFNKSKRTLTVHTTAERGTVFTLQQSVKNYVPAEAVATKMTPAQRRKALFEDFGSAKKRKVLKSQDANRVSVESVVGAGSVMAGAFSRQTNMSESNRKALEESKRGEKMDAIESSYSEARKRFLPSFDVDAKEPHLVYGARDIAGDEAWGCISRVADACLHKGPIKFVSALTERGTWHESTLQVLNDIPLDAPNAKHQVKTAILLNHLITFHTRKPTILRGDPQSIAKELGLPNEVCERFLDLFATSVGGGRDTRYASSKQDKDKTLVHLLLLYMICQGKTMKVGSFRPVMDDIKLQVSEATNLLREAGCTVQRQGVTNISAVLTVPLTFPPPRRGGRRPN